MGRKWLECLTVRYALPQLSEQWDYRQVQKSLQWRETTNRTTFKRSVSVIQLWGTLCRYRRYGVFWSHQRVLHTHPINTCALITQHDFCSRSTWPCLLRRPSAAARLLGSRPAESIDVRHCDRLISSSEAPYRGCLIASSINLTVTRPGPQLRSCAAEYIYIKPIYVTGWVTRRPDCAKEESGLDSRRRPKYFNSLHSTSRPNQTGAGVHQPSHAIPTH